MARLGAATLVARHHPANEGSGRIVTKLGMHLHDDGTDRYGRPCRISVLPCDPRKPPHPTDRTRRSSRLDPPPVRAPPTSGWRTRRHGHRSRVLRLPRAGTTREEGGREGVRLTLRTPSLPRRPYLSGRSDHLRLTWRMPSLLTGGTACQEGAITCV
ncbi:hypothetical protein GCM10020219_052430 [Nonomuraea dietziae]